MSKDKIKRKYKKLFSKYNKKELKEILEREIDNYIRIVKSEEIASKILKQYYLPYYDMHEDYKMMVQQFILYCKEKGINYKIDNDISITNEEIATRINENKYYQLSVIEELGYLYDEFLYDETLNHPQKIDYDSINNMYDFILNNIKKENEKVMVKKHE